MMWHFVPRTINKTSRLREPIDAVGSSVDNKTNEPDCGKEADAAHEAANKDQAEYDKQLLTLSTAVLALSVGLIKNVVPLATAIWKGSLYTSFVLLATAIVLVLFSYQFSILGNQKARQFWLDRAEGKYTEFPNRIATLAVVLNRLCGAVFLAGVITTVAFVIANFHQEAEMANKPDYSDMNGGQCIKIPAGSGTEERGSLLKVPAQQPKPSSNPNQSGGSGQK